MEEAKTHLVKALKQFEDMTYAELVDRVGETFVYEKEIVGGHSYQIEIQILWDSSPQNSIRIIGSIDDGGWRAFFPLTDSILKLPPKQL